MFRFSAEIIVIIIIIKDRDQGPHSIKSKFQVSAGYGYWFVAFSANLAQKKN